MVYRRQEAQASAAQPGMIQIWSLDTSDPTDFDIDPVPSGKGRGLRLDLAIIVEAEMLALKWCPKGGKRASSLKNDERLGLVASLTSDGRLHIYDVPYPAAAKSAHGVEHDDILFCEREFK